MAQSISHMEPLRESPNETTAPVTRLRTVTGNKFPRKCACGCGHQIPRDPEVRYVVDFGAVRPYPAYLREHSPDYGTYHARTRGHENTDAVPGFRPASELPRESRETPRPPEPPTPPARPKVEVAHTEEETTASPEAGRPWASGQLVFNAGQFESARSGFADYSRDGESAKELRMRVNRMILEDLEAKVLALRALHAKLRVLDAGESFGDIVARSRPRSGAP